MKKEELIGKRVAIATSSQLGVYKGMTGTVVGKFRARMFDVVLDGEVKMNDGDKILTFFDSELYFPNNPLGYNQKCFNQYE